MPSEYPVQVKFGGGLSPDEEIRVEGTGHVHYLLDGRPTPHGLAVPHTPSNPISNPSIAVAWPFPQLLQLPTQTLYMNEAAMYTVNESTWVGTDVSGALYDAAAPASLDTLVTGGGLWQGVGLESLYFLTNAKNFVYYSSTLSDRKYLCKDVVVQAVGKLDNRLVLGGLSGAHFATSSWTDLFAHWRKYAGNQHSFASKAFGTNYIVIGQEYGGDTEYPNETLLSALGISFYFSQLKEVIYTAFEQGDLQLIPLPTNGTVLAVKQLGNRLAVYTSRGCFILNPETALVDVTQQVACAGRGAVCGDDEKQLFVDKNGVLWSAQVNNGFTRLGYEEYLSTLTAANIIINYDPMEEEYYICDGVTCYVLTKSGMFESSYLPTSVHRYDNDLVGVLTGAVSTFQVNTKTLRFGYAGLKSITFVELQCQGITAPQVRVHYWYGQNLGWILSNWVYGSPEGRFYIGVMANEFRLHVKGIMSGTAKLEEAIVRIQYGDDSTVRGPRGAGFGTLQASEGNS